MNGNTKVNFNRTLQAISECKSLIECQLCNGTSKNFSRTRLACHHWVCGKCLSLVERCPVCDKAIKNTKDLYPEIQYDVCCKLQTCLELQGKENFHPEKEKNTKNNQQKTGPQNCNSNGNSENTRLTEESAVLNSSDMSAGEEDFQNVLKSKPNKRLETPSVRKTRRNRYNLPSHSNKEIDTATGSSNNPLPTEININTKLLNTPKNQPIPGITSKSCPNKSRETTFINSRKGFSTPCYNLAARKTKLIPIHDTVNNQVTPVRKRKSNEITTPLSNPHTPRMRSLIKNTPKSEKKNKRGESPLHVACIKGDLAMVKKLLEEDVNINLKDNAGWTPLHEAANHGHEQIVKVLLEKGAGVNTPGYNNECPLIDAVKNNRYTVAKVLLDHGADMNLRNSTGESALSLAEVNQEMLRLFSVYKNKKLPIQTESTNLNLNNYKQPDNIVLWSSGNVSWDKVLKVAEIVKGTTVREIEKQVPPTHLIVSTASEDKRSPRTLKYLQGVARGLWVLQEEWLDGCIENKSWISEENYEVNGSIKDVSPGGPKRSRLNTTLQCPGLLDGCHFFLTREFKSLKKSDVIGLIQVSGGIVLHREPKPDSDTVLSCTKVPYHAIPDSTQYLKTYYILYDDENGKPFKNVSCGKVETVPLSWLLDSISNFALAYPEMYNNI